MQHFGRGVADEAYVCGPDTMIETVTATLADLGMPKETIHSERFGVPRKSGKPAPAVVVDTQYGET